MHLEVSRVPFAEKQALRDNVYLILLTPKKIKLIISHSCSQFTSSIHHHFMRAIFLSE
ncbi:hypothetical protein Peur_009311 [Populus x canadensis]